MTDVYEGGGVGAQIVHVVLLAPAVSVWIRLYDFAHHYYYANLFDKNMLRRPKCVHYTMIIDSKFTPHSPAVVSELNCSVKCN